LEELKTLKILINSDIFYEVRTTVHTSLLDEKDINEIIKTLKDENYKKEYFIQNFIDNGKTLKKLKEQKYYINPKNIKDDISIKYRNFRM